MTPVPNTPLRRIVVDEAVTSVKWARFEKHAKAKGWAELETLFVRDRHPGMPDGQILHHLLDASTILVTADRPFHNEVLSRGLRSYYVISPRPISGRCCCPSRRRA